MIPDPDPNDPQPELIGYVVMCTLLAVFIFGWTLAKLVG
jgi:hypothetical protein